MVIIIIIIIIITIIVIFKKSLWTSFFGGLRQSLDLLKFSKQISLGRSN